jgi:hypothetical protein
LTYWAFGLECIAWGCVTLVLTAVLRDRLDPDRERFLRLVGGWFFIAAGVGWVVVSALAA